MWNSLFGSKADAAAKSPAGTPEGEKRKAGPMRALDQVSAENYLDVGRAMVAEFVETVQGRPEDGWQLAKTQDGVTIHRKATASSDINRLRGQTTINVAPEKVFEALVDSTHLKYVDQLYISSKVCEQYDPEHAILHYQFKFPFPLYPRDFQCLEVYTKVDDETWLAIARSVDSGHVPTTEQYVRADLRASGYQIKAVAGNPDACVVTYICECDPCGYLPKWAVNFDVDQPLVLAKIKLLLEKGVKSFNK